MTARLQEIEVPTLLSLAQAQRARERFLKGPIPMTAIWIASQLPGRSLALYLAIRHQCDLSRKSSVKVPATLLRSFGIDKDAKARALVHLCAAGLVAVEQQPGTSAKITLTGEERPR